MRNTRPSARRSSVSSNEEEAKRRLHPGGFSLLALCLVAITISITEVTDSCFPLTQRANITDIVEAVCGICVDEIHNLNIATRAGAEASDTLKYFSERIPAIFVLAGISVERAGLLSGTRGEQIAGRFYMVRTGSFPCNEQWATLISALEGSLRLHRHQPGTLPEMARYLHQRTGGMIGSLLWLIRSAIQAVIDGTEQVTRKAMDAIPVDISSQACAVPELAFVALTWAFT
jgi:hypothetical protein